MFKLILPIIASISLYAESISLSDLAFIVQKKDKVSIIFSNDVQKNTTVDFPSDYSKSDYLPLFKSILSANGFKLTNNEGMYIVGTSNANDTDSSKSLIAPSGSGDLLPPPALVSGSAALTPPSVILQGANSLDLNVTFVSHKLDYLQLDSIKPLLDFSGLAYSFSPVSKTITFKQSKQNKQLIKNLIKAIEDQDVLKNQVTMKITIFDTNQNKLKEVGFNPSLTFDFGLLSQVGSVLSGANVTEFKASLKFLESQGVTSIVQSTSYLVSDDEKLEFKKVLSIPFLDENYVVTNQSVSNQTTKHKYKDIGFVVDATPTIVGDTIYLDFTLSIGNVVSGGDLPTTSTSSITNKFSLHKGEVLLLAGISKKTLIGSDSGLPNMESLPFWKRLFTQTSDNTTDETFSVSIEIL